LNYLEDFRTYWVSHLNDLVPVDDAFTSRAAQDQELPYVVLQLGESGEIEEDTGLAYVDRQIIEIHIFAVDSKVVKLARQIRSRLDNARISEDQAGLLYKGREYDKGDTDIHHFMIRYEWWRNGTFGEV
jgi:hypothetical protein